jgi:hypothetical protein
MESTDLKDWREVTFELEGQDGEFEGVYLQSTQLLRIKLPRQSQGWRNYKLTVE